MDIFFANLVDLIAQEDTIQQKLRSENVSGGMPGGLAESKTRMRYDYLIQRQGDGSRAKISELRMNDKGVEMHGVGTDNGFVMTSGFALSCVHFSSAVQWDSKFVHIGETLKEEAEKNDEKPIRPFVLYDLRHTFLTRLGESGCDVWTLARIAGHSNIKQSSRYVHPSNDAVLDAMERMGGHKASYKSGGHKIGHTAKAGVREARARRLLTQ